MKAKGVLETSTIAAAIVKLRLDHTELPEFHVRPAYLQHIRELYQTGTISEADGAEEAVAALDDSADARSARAHRSKGKQGARGGGRGGRSPSHQR